MAHNQICFIVLALFCFLGSLVQVTSKDKIWGVGVDEDGNQQKVRQDKPAFGASSFEELQKQAERMNSGAGGFGDLGLADLMKDLDLGSPWMMTLTDYLAEFMEKPEVKKLLDDPALLIEQLQQEPLFANDQELMQLLESDEFKDPEKLKGNVQQVVDALGQWGADFDEMMKKLGDPAQDPVELLGEYLKDLDPQALEELQSLFSDEGTMEMVAKEMGNVFKEMEETFKDPTILIELQEALLNDPNLADSNTPEMKELLENPVKLAEYVQATLGGVQELFENPVNFGEKIQETLGAAQDWLNQAEAAA